MRKSVIQYKENVREMFRLAADRPIIFFDLETTGLRPSIDRILSFSAVKCVLGKGSLKETDRIDLFINPGFSIPYEASKVNGITNERVKDCPRERGAFPAIHRFLGEQPLVAGYNSVSFDQKFMDSMYMRQLGREFTPAAHVDVMKMAKEKLECERYTLKDVAREMGCDAGISFHNSIDDVIATKRVFTLLAPYYIKEEKEEKKEGGRRLAVKSVSYWAPSHRLARLYVRTYPYSRTYFDLYKKEWHTDMEGADLDQLSVDVLLYTQSKDERELAKKAPSYKS